MEWIFLRYPLDEILCVIQALLMSYNVNEAYIDHPIQYHNLCKHPRSGTPYPPYSAHIFLFFCQVILYFFIIPYNILIYYADPLLSVPLTSS